MGCRGVGPRPAGCERGRQPRTETAAGPQLGDLLHRLSWILYGRQYATTIYETTSIRHRTVFRDGYARSRFADVGTPDEAMTRFETLDNAQRMQLLAMFERVDEK